jgi:ribosomal-protein-alanine N-acetyltransferase
MIPVEQILSERLSLVTLDATMLGAMVDGGAPPGAFTWPSWWPDQTDRDHLALWLQRARGLDGLEEWQPRAIVERAPMTMIGHAGFHLPPRPLEEALADPSFQGAADPVAGAVVEIGYTIFPPWRRRGFATEAVTALVEWAFGTHGVGAVLASVEERNTASQVVLARVGGFRSMGTCQSTDGSVEIVMRRDGP